MKSALDLGFIRNNPNFDNSIPFNSFLAGSEESIYFPAGDYTFLTQTDDINRTVIIEGHSMSTTGLVRKFSGDMLKFKAAIGSRLSNISIMSEGTTTGGIAVLLESQSTGESPDYMSISNVNVSAYSGSWMCAFSFDGVRRANQALSGLRDIYAVNIYAFASTYASIYCNTVHGATFNCNCFQAGGTTQDIKFNAWSSDPNTGINFTSPAPITNLQLWNINNSVFTAPSYQNIDHSNSSVKII